MSQNNQPVAQFKLGLVKAVVWANETSGGVRHNVTFVRIYRKEDQWRDMSALVEMTCHCWPRCPIRHTPGSSNNLFPSLSRSSAW